MHDYTVNPAFSVEPGSVQLLSALPATAPRAPSVKPAQEGPEGGRNTGVSDIEKRMALFKSVSILRNKWVKGIGNHKRGKKVLASNKDT